MSVIRGSLSIVDSLESTSATKALSAARGRQLSRDLINRGLPAWTYFFNPRVFTPSASTPFLRADLDHSSLSAANWPELVPLLTGFNYVAGSTSTFTATPSIGSDPELILQNDADHIQLVTDFLNDVRFFNWNEAGNDIAAFDDTVFANYEMVIQIVTSSVVGLVAGSKYRIKYVSSLANTLDPTARRIRVATTTSGGASAVTFRVTPFLRLSDANARWRRINDAVLQSGFAGLRRLDTFQSHWHSDMDSGGTPLGYANVQAGSGQNVPVGGISSPIMTIKLPVTDGTNGTPRTGNKTRPRAGGAYLYMLGGAYTP